jgi:hypothetical protein
MGFFDKVKGTAKQAVHPQDQLAERSKIMRINEFGVEQRATLLALREGDKQFGGAVQIDFDLTVHPDGGESYPASVSQSMLEGAMRGIAVGGDVTVRVDPDDPQSLMVWGGA